MTAKKLYFCLIGLLILLGIGLLAGAREANMLLASKSASLVGLKAKNQALNNEETQLAKDKQDVTKYANLNVVAQSVVPQDKDQAEAVREIVNLASASGIKSLSSVTFPASTLGAKGGKSLTQVTPVKGIPGVYDLQITVMQAGTNEVPYNSFISFLSRLEQNRRTAVISSISITPDITTPNMVSFTLVIDEFIKP